MPRLLDGRGGEKTQGEMLYKADKHLSIIGLKWSHGARSIGQGRFIKRKAESGQSLFRCRDGLLSEKCR
jgi:hypothetical protein